MIIRHPFFAKGVIGLFALLTIISCAGVAMQSGSQAPAQSGDSQVMRGLKKTTVTSVKPNILTLEAGKSMGAAISGTGLTEARTLLGQRKGQPVRSITGVVRCGRTPSCPLTLSTTEQTPAGSYQIALLDKNQLFLTHLPVNLTVEAKVPTARATISSMRPDKLVVQSGNALETTIIGDGLRAAQSIEGWLGKEPDKTIRGSVNCGKERSCVVKIATEPETQAGAYQIALLDSKRRFLVALPGKLTVEAKDAPPPPPLFSCAPGAAENTTTIITGPIANGDIRAGTVLQWERTGHDICGGLGSNKRYAVAVCRLATPGSCLPNNGFYNALVSPEDLGWEVTDPGVYTLSEENIDQIKKSRSNLFPPFDELETGAPVFFQIRYNYSLFTTQYGEWDTRELTLNLDPPVGNDIPLEAPQDAPQLFLPPVYSPNGPFNVSWGSVADTDYYRVQLIYRAGSPSGTDFGVVIGESDVREVSGNSAELDVALPSHTSLVVWVVAACNAVGCSQNAVHGVFVDPPAISTVSFSTIAPVFKAPSCVNCHAVVPTNYENQDAQGYEAPGSDNFGLPPNHPGVNANSDCVGCHTAVLTPGGSHPVPWQAPTDLDLRNKNDFELCQMAKDPGTLAENIEDHLLGDPLILWAINAGELPQNAGPTDAALQGGESDWINRVQAWVSAGASCD